VINGLTNEKKDSKKCSETIKIYNIKIFLRIFFQKYYLQNFGGKLPRLLATLLGIEVRQQTFPIAMK
jgi:hypothetical protein